MGKTRRSNPEFKIELLTSAEASSKILSLLYCSVPIKKDLSTWL